MIADLPGQRQFCQFCQDISHTCHGCRQGQQEKARKKGKARQHPNTPLQTASSEYSQVLDHDPQDKANEGGNKDKQPAVDDDLRKANESFAKHSVLNKSLGLEDMDTSINREREYDVLSLSSFEDDDDPQHKYIEDNEKDKSPQPDAQ